MKNTKTTLSTAQIEALIYLWKTSQKSAEKFLQDLGITIKRNDPHATESYVNKYMTKDDYATYSDSDRR